jgi:hypothetical protein
VRLTKVQIYWWLTLAVPLVVSCLLLAIAAASDEPRPRDDARIDFAFYCFVAAIAISVFMFPMLALRERPQQIGGQYFTHRVWFLTVVNLLATFVFAATIAYALTRPFVPDSIRTDGVAAWGTFFLLALLMGLVPWALNTIASWWAKRTGKQTLALGVSFFNMAGPRVELEPDLAEQQWATMWRMPDGGTREGAWRYLDTQALRVHSRDVEGTRWMLYRKIPKVPWPAWTVGLFIDRTRHWDAERATTSLRFFKRWNPCRPEPAAGPPAGVPSPAANGAISLRCVDCGGFEVRGLGTDGSDILVEARPKPPPEALWIAGVMLTIAAFPKLASARPDAAPERSPVPPGAPPEGEPSSNR